MRRIIIAIALFGASACATTGDGGPDVPLRSEFGYQCSGEYTCPADLRCYLRFPNSVGRCVTEEYYSTNPRGCLTDQDCEATEICQDVDYPRHGECRPRFQPTARRGR